MGSGGLRLEWYERDGSVVWSRGQLDTLWTADEVRLLMENYPGHGYAWDGWADVLPGRSPGAIKSKAAGLGVSTGRRWTRAERDALAANYRGHGASWDGWAEILPGRSAAAIKNMAQTMGVRCGIEEMRGDWSPAEDAVLMGNCAHGPSWDGWSELLPGRTRGAISVRASKLGVGMGRGGHGARKWSGEEDRKIKEVLSKLALATGRTERAVAMRMAAIAEDTQTGEESE